MMVNDKSLCCSCANSCADYADKIFKQLANDGIYIWTHDKDDILYTCMSKVKKRMTYDDGVLVSCSDYVRRSADDNADHRL